MNNARQLGALAALLLVACGAESAAEGPPVLVEANDISLEEMRSLMAGQGLLTPGLYRVTGTVLSVDYPALDSDDQQARAVSQLIRGRLADVPPVESQACIAEGAAFDPRGQYIAGCGVPNFRLEGTEIAFDMTCPTLDGAGTATGEYTGTVSPDGYVLSSSSQVPSTPGPTAEPRMATVNVELVGERIGDCE